MSASALLEKTIADGLSSVSGLAGTPGGARGWARLLFFVELVRDRGDACVSLRDADGRRHRSVVEPFGIGLQGWRGFAGRPSARTERTNHEGSEQEPLTHWTHL